MKWVTSLLGSCFLLAVLAGCGGGSSTSTTPPPPPPPPPPLPAGTELLYVGDNVGVIHGFAVDPGSGKLTPLSTVAVTKQATAADVGLAADLGGMVLYATSAGVGGSNVLSFIVNKTTGALTPAGNVTLPVPPRKLAAIEGNLYVIPDPSANAAQMFAFSINGLNAALTQLSPTVTLPGPPHDLAIAGFGNNIPSWMGLTFDGTSGGEIQGIVRQPNGGATGLQLGSPTSSGGDSPQGIRVTPDGNFVIVANQGTSNVSVFSLDATTGALTEVPGSPFPSGQQPGPVAIDPPTLAGPGPAPSGKFVFVGDTGGNSLSAYAIDSAGSLTPVPGTPISLGDNAQPLSIAVDLAGKFVYVSMGTQQVAGFAIDPTTGALTPISGSPFSVGAVTRDMVFVPGATQ
jgi:6-phosphogluconolactonase (cycloisomerase 2 family)